jgi:ankyrin repeat protein
MPDRSDHRLTAWSLRMVGLLVLTLACAAQAGENLSSPQAQREADVRLLQATQKGSVSLVQAALAEGANVNCRGTNGLSPLLQVLSGTPAPLDASRRQCVAFLLQRGADVNTKDRDGRTALIHATRAGDLATAQMLVEAGAAITLRDRFSKTALLYAADGHREILLYLGNALKVQQNAPW